MILKLLVRPPAKQTAKPLPAEQYAHPWREQGRKVFAEMQEKKHEQLDRSVLPEVQHEQPREQR